MVFRGQYRRCRLAVIPLSAVLVLGTARSETYYISPDGNNANNCAAALSPSAPKRTFAAAWACLSPGDVLIAKDGIYDQNLAPPPGKAGESGRPITIKAETDGSVLINGEANLIANSYLTFQGFRMKGKPGRAVFSISSKDSAATASHHIVLQRMGLECPLTGREARDGVCVGIAAGAHHNLLEDCWAWGGGRYTVMIYGRDNRGQISVTGADFNTLRRLVLRMGPHVSSGGNPQAASSIYYGSNNLIENVLVLDSEPNSDSSNAAFYLTGHDPPPEASGNKYYGVVALNTQGRNASGFYLDVDRGGISSSTEIHNSVFWGSTAGGVYVYNHTASNNAGMLIRQVTAGHNGGDGYQNHTEAVLVRSSIFYGNGGYGMSNGRRGSTLGNYNLIFGHARGARNNVAAGPNDITLNPFLTYITRTERNSPCNARDGGTGCGADVTKRYLNGNKTAIDLWPWPNEDRIKKEMCASTKRGFCAEGKRLDGTNPVTLTSYVWEYLGHAMPEEIYAGAAPR